MTTAISTLEMTREEWLAARRQGIGGSDVAAILGLSPWKTPLDVYLEKTSEPGPSEETPAMYWGSVLEAVVAGEFVKRTGMKVRRMNRIFADREFPFLIGNIDRDIVGVPELLECKTTSGFNKDQWGEQGTDEIPFPYLCQVMHYLAILDYRLAHVAVLIDGRDFRTYRVARNERLIEAIRARCVEFWQNHVVAGVAPAPQNSADLETLYRDGGREGVAVATAEIEALAVDLAKLKEQEKALGEQVTAAEDAIKGAMGEAAELVGVSGKPLATWKASTSSRFDSTAFKKANPALAAEFTKETTSRRFLLKVKAE